MARKPRPLTISLRLDEEEFALREALGRRYGIDGSGVLRQALRRWAREEGIVAEPPPPAKKAK